MSNRIKDFYDIAAEVDGKIVTSETISKMAKSVAFYDFSNGVVKFSELYRNAVDYCIKNNDYYSYVVGSSYQSIIVAYIKNIPFYTKKQPNIRKANILYTDDFVFKRIKSTNVFKISYGDFYYGIDDLDTVSTDSDKRYHSINGWFYKGCNCYYLKDQSTIVDATITLIDVKNENFKISWYDETTGSMNWVEDVSCSELKLKF